MQKFQENKCHNCLAHFKREYNDFCYTVTGVKITEENVTRGNIKETDTVLIIIILYKYKQSFIKKSTFI